MTSEQDEFYQLMWKEITKRGSDINKASDCQCIQYKGLQRLCAWHLEKLQRIMEDENY